MYSSYGKQASNRYKILNEKEEILLGGHKIYHVDRPKFDKIFKRALSPESLMKMIKKSMKDDRISAAKEASPSKNSASFMAQSREAFYRSNSSKAIGSSGMYNCKYDLISKRPRVTKIVKEKPKSSSKPTENGYTFINPEKVSKHIPSPVSFEKQLPKLTKKAISTTPDPYDGEKPKKCVTPNISKYLARNYSYLPKNRVAACYEPSYKLVENNLGRAPSFEKYTSREPIVIEHLVNSRVYQPNYAIIEKRRSSPDLSKGKKPSLFPEFMTTNSSRIGLNMLSEKMLQMNMFIKDNC